MKINTANVTYSSIVKIGEEISKLEKETGEKYLKLHRGVMDVTAIDIDSLNIKLGLNDKKTQQYSGNDGHPELIETIKKEFLPSGFEVIVTPGGMAALDLAINSLADQTIWIPKYHWGSWNKILKTHEKDMQFFDDFNLDSFRPEFGAVMLCCPSNPTGYCPDKNAIVDFLKWSNDNGITVILDLPYYYLFNEFGEIEEYFSENVIVVSSFSKSIGLSGYRVGYIATKSDELYQTLKIRSLYKYNSISTLPQIVVNELIKEKKSIEEYKAVTKAHISKNIEFLKENNLLFSEYAAVPIGPFAIVCIDYKKLLDHRISSVPLSKFTLIKNNDCERFSRISVAVDHNLFKEYFDRMLASL